MRQIQPDLWETDVESPFPGLTTHAYLLTHVDGNVLFYNTGHQHEIDSLAELGGVALHFLSHRDELGESINQIAERFGARLGAHLLEREDVSRVRRPDILFEAREILHGGIEVIPTPGHSPGSTCFLVHAAGGRQYLFTGDTLYLAGEDTWKPGLLPGSDGPTLRESLMVLRELAPDLVMSSAFVGEAGFREIPAGEWPLHVDAALARLDRALGKAS